MSLNPIALLELICKIAFLLCCLKYFFVGRK